MNGSSNSHPTPDPRSQLQRQNQRQVSHSHQSLRKRWFGLFISGIFHTLCYTFEIIGDSRVFLIQFSQYVIFIKNAHINFVVSLPYTEGGNRNWFKSHEHWSCRNVAVRATVLRASRSAWPCKLSASPEPLNQKLGRWAPTTCVTSPPADSDARPSSRKTLSLFFTDHRDAL